jgi:hypothetical protein
LTSSHTGFPPRPSWPVVGHGAWPPAAAVPVGKLVATTTAHPAASTLNNARQYKYLPHPAGHYISNYAFGAPLNFAPTAFTGSAISVLKDTFAWADCASFLSWQNG